MTTRESIGLLIVGILSGVLISQYFNKPKEFKGPAQISYHGDTIIVKQKGKPDFKEFQPDPKSTVITTDAKGNVTVKVRQVGLGIDPGVGVGYSDRLRLALDIRYAYFKRFGANAGLGLSLTAADYNIKSMNLGTICDPYLGISFVPLTSAPNTDIVVAGTLSKHVFVFVRMRL